MGGGGGGRGGRKILGHPQGVEFQGITAQILEVNINSKQNFPGNPDSERYL